MMEFQRSNHSITAGLAILVTFIAILGLLFKLLQPEVFTRPAPDVDDATLICFSHAANHDGLTGELERSYPDRVFPEDPESAKCPEGGTYTYGESGFVSRCSYHGVPQFALRWEKKSKTRRLLEKHVPFVGPTAALNTCVATLKQIDGAKQQWSFDTRAKGDSLPKPKDLFGPKNYIKVIPACPNNGHYFIGKVADRPECTCKALGHTL